MKRFFLVVLLILCLTVPMLFMSGCTKKEEPKTEEPVMEQQNEEAPAPVDTTAVAPDTTEM